MFRTLIGTLVIAAAPTVMAEPTGQPTTTNCNVQIMRAPDDVRAQIEEWVQREPVCKTSLEVRVVPTEGGLYLFARDASGRTRDRIVPDGQAAGVLVASWIADDSVDTRVTADGIYVPPAKPLPATAMIEPAFGSPGFQDSIPVSRPRDPSSLTFTVGAFGGAEAAGARFDLELPITQRSEQGSAGLVTFTAGLARSAYFNSDGYNMPSSGEATEFRVAASVGGILSTDDWQLRARGGVLARIMSMEQHSFDEFYNRYDMQARMGVMYGWEAALLGARKLTPRWALLAGPIISGEIESDGLPDTVYETEVSVYAGLAYAR
jgi:hypothetical protein